MYRAHMNHTPIIFGLSGTKLTEQEIAFFSKARPIGFILFSRNIESKEQVKALTKSLRDLMQNEDIPIMIDQEGGRVARIKPPLMKEYKPAKYFGDMALSDLEKAVDATYENYLAMGKELISLGINVNCAPVADLLIEGADDIIGDRSFGSSVSIVSQLCDAACLGLMDADVHPIVKHIPGHGRATCDSHKDLPVVTTDLKTLEETDFRVFKSLSSLDVWAMTAHVKFDALDKDSCVTLSQKAISYIRNELGYEDHVIISDDMSMKALKGDIGENAAAAMLAGCDLILHCNGEMEEMKSIYSAIERLRQTEEAI